MEKIFADIAVVGGGASGMLCAATAAEKNKNKRIVLIEKENKIGRKLLATGNGRCNLTNLNACAASYHGSFADYAGPLLRTFTPKEVIRRFAELGLLCASEQDGRVYPLSRHSASVTEVLSLALERSGAMLLNGAKVEKITKEKRKFSLLCGDHLVISEKVVICTGGMTYPKLGSDGSIFPLLKALGHTVTELFPALCPIPCGDKALKLLKGVRCRGKAVLMNGETPVKEETGEIQFTEKALSGVCVFNLAREVNGLKEPVLSLSLLPDYSKKELLLLLQRQRKIFAAFPPENIFTGIFHKNVSIALIGRLNIKKTTCAELTDSELSSLAETVSDWRFKVSALGSTENAQITAGGVSGEQIDPDTLESRIVKDLFFCGEVIDIDGDCGGYNLHFAFASALKVGDGI